MTQRGKTLTVECDRCGNQQTVERAGRFRDEDYYELWQEYAELEQHYQEALERIEQLQTLVGHLEVPTLEQIELRALRGQLDALLPPPLEIEEAA